MQAVKSQHATFKIVGLSLDGFPFTVDNVSKVHVRRFISLEPNASGGSWADN